MKSDGGDDDMRGSISAGRVGKGLTLWPESWKATITAPRFKVTPNKQG